MLTSRSDVDTPARVVDEVGVDPPAAECVDDPPALGETEIGALSDDPATQFVRIHPDRVVNPVADLLMGLVGGLDVGADPTQPEQVNRRPGSSPG